MAVSLRTLGRTWGTESHVLFRVLKTSQQRATSWTLRPCLYSSGRLPLVQGHLISKPAQSGHTIQPRNVSLQAKATATATAPHIAPSSSETKNVVEILRERGLIESVTSEELDKAAATGRLKVYCGFDPTAESLHLGNLLGIVVLSWFQRCGHQPVALVGGATARVGDPSGKSVERPLLDEATLNRNLAGIRKTLEKLLDSSTGPEPLILNNYEWFKEFSLLDFLRDVGKHVRVGTMLSKESVKTRLASDVGMSFTEFCYQLLQGYDFVHLFEQHGVNVQIGGSDQWGNITAGTDLVRKLLRKEGAYGLTFPLLLQADGRKFGKSESGAVWLSETFLSPYKFYQYLFSTADADVIRVMRMLTFIDMAEVTALEKSMTEPGYLPNTVQRQLAEEVTKFVHGEEGLRQAISATEALAPGAKTRLDVTALEAIAADAPSRSLPASDVVGYPVVDVMVACSLQPSKAAARRLIKGGGVYLNNVKVEADTRVVEQEDLVGGTMLLLAAGKKNKMIVRVQTD